MGLKTPESIARVFPTGLTFLAVNYEMLWRRMDVIMPLNWDMVVADESHRMKNHSSKQSKAMHQVSQEVDYRIALTGTPMEDNEIDLWAQFRFVDDSLLGDNWWRFSKTWCRPAGFGGYDIKLKPKAKKKLLKIAGDNSFQIKKKDALDLPPTTDQALYFSLTGKIKEAYDKMEENFYYKFGEAKSISEMQATTLIRLQQLTGGFLAADRDKLIRLEQDKLFTLLDYLQDIPKKKKIVIFARFTAEIDVLEEALLKQGRTVGVLKGRSKNPNIWMEFQDKKDPAVIIVQSRSGIGIDLFASDLAFFYSHTFSFIDYDQMRKRLDRNGQKSKVTFIHVMAKDTVDVDVYDSLNIKGKNANDVLAIMQQRRRRSRMAKKSKTVKKAGKKKEKKKPVPPKIEKPDFGVDELAKELGVTPSIARQKLRASGMTKEGRAWDFKSAAGVKKAAKACGGGKPAKAEKKKAGKKKKTKKSDEE